MNLQCISYGLGPTLPPFPGSSRDGGVGAKVDTDDRVPRRNAIETLNSTQMIPLHLPPFASLFPLSMGKTPAQVNFELRLFLKRAAQAIFIWML